eukprot:CAMPEP_0174713544 /NCGR_PEP_ID=MMETSP1094-20130205/14176_1 /TAXON_ID=156173 /ORGANISM="Chrysochromulina brevifilum, Strain UTEX LB 985" /LENGTH=110 /DNA_ID=CAMNT_0015912729 /DNA_START=244 /DNA_END=576 /DNA_ORIENTATION=+
MANPELAVFIRLANVIAGVLHALLPRSTQWKLSLYISSHLVIAGVAVHYAYLLGSPSSLLSFLLDSCAPFLLAFGAIELASRTLRYSGKVPSEYSLLLQRYVECTPSAQW